MNFPKGILRKEQLRHYNSVKWLLTDGPHEKREELPAPVQRHRQTGRSTLMAIIFIEEAMERPGKPIRIFDHYDNKVSHKYMVERIKKLLSEDKSFAKQFKFQGRRMTFRP